MDNNKEKIVLKRSALPGVDMSIVDLTQVHTVKVRFTIVKKPMYKVRRQTFIGTRDQLDKMDVIQLGPLKLKYRVLKLAKMTDFDGYIYKIKRIDGEATVGVDIDNADKIGQKVSIVNRPTFENLFSYACSMLEEVPDPVTVDLCSTDACDNPGLPTTSKPVEPTLKEYEIVNTCCDYQQALVEWNGSNGFDDVILYKPKADETIKICAIEGSVRFTLTNNSGTVTPSFYPWPNNVPCPPGVTCITSTPTLTLLGDC